MAIRQLAHGWFSLVPTLLTMFGWFAALFQDGCDYVKVTGPIVQEIATQPNAPYLEAGRNAYREPYYNAKSDSWSTEYIGQCLIYPEDQVDIDTYWTVSKGLDFASIVLGGTGTLFLWFSACCVFSRGTWRLAGCQVLFACLFQAASFLWFRTSLCEENTCELFWGSKADIAACVLWFLAAMLIFCYYPVPRDHVARMMENRADQDGIVVTSPEVSMSAQSSLAEAPQTSDENFGTFSEPKYDHQFSENTENSSESNTQYSGETSTEKPRKNLTSLPTLSNSNAMMLLLVTLAGASQGFLPHPVATSSRCRSQPLARPDCRACITSGLFAKETDVDEVEGDSDDKSINVESDSRLYRLRLSRAPGIEWGTDLSFSFVYVRDMDPTGDAAMSNEVQKGDQLCEVTPIKAASGERGEPINLVGAPFDFVMESFAMLDKTVKDVDLVFFRGTKDELKAAATGKDGSTDDQEMITVMVYENKGTASEVIHRLRAPAGVNIRQLCVDNSINVYQSVTRWTNCKGKQLCGTCIVNVADGGVNTNRKSMDEASTLRENPETYRLSCVTFAYGDCAVETFPPINAAQWTR